jgi:hypothetical protein
MSLIIPKQPEELVFHIDRLWNGEVCPDDRLKAAVTISQTQDGLLVRASMPELHDQKVPEVQKGKRVDNLWTFDVVELFLVGPGHRYLEIELGAGGHWLVLGFDRLRHRESDHELLKPWFRFWKTEKKEWFSQITIPWNIVPENLRAINAFVIAAGKHLSFSPLPGDKPDFHQPDSYPSVQLQ